MASNSLVIRDFRSLPGKLSADGRRYVFPLIKTKSRTGGESFWEIGVGVLSAIPEIAVQKTITENPFEKSAELLVPIKDEWFNNAAITENIVGVLKVNSGKVGGKVRISAPTFITGGKNIGASNETNIFCQALRDALSEYNKKLKKTITESAGVDIHFPMLAQNMADQDPDFVKFGFEKVFEQIKYNGLRSMAVDNVMYSRRGHFYPGFTLIKQIMQKLAAVIAEKYPHKIYFDGELYKHGATLQYISGVARKKDNVETQNEIKYIIYDVYIPAVPEMLFSKRAELMREFSGILSAILAGNVFKAVEFAPTYEISAAADMVKHYQEFLAAGYEGAMIRLDRPYVCGIKEYHSNVLLKVKPSYDAEFEVVSVFAAEKGKARGALMLQCKTKPADKTEPKYFNVTPAVPLAERISIYEKWSQDESVVRGHMLVVTFDEYSKDGVPQRARTSLLFRKNNDSYYKLT